MAFWDQDKQKTRSLAGPTISGTHLLSLCQVKAHVVHEDFEYTKTNPLASLRLSLAQNGFPCTCVPDFPRFWYIEGMKDHTAEKQIVREILTSPDSGYIEHGHVHQAGAKWCAHQRLYYHTYFIPKDIHVQDCISFACESDLSIEVHLEEDYAMGVEEEAVVQEDIYRSRKLHATAISEDWDLAAGTLPLIE